MTNISPLLISQLNKNQINVTNGTQNNPKNNSGTQGGIKNNTQNNNYHEQIYQNLKRTANTVKPNQPKAKLVNEGMLGNPITATKDTFKDAKNFFKITATGKASDTDLGRINNLGLKTGALIIATFLASRAKTKTDAIMQFVGGGAFLAAMSLWPKLFINIPARLVHGFRIDRKYISAQGEKKDFGLDNQFLVWDAYPEEQLRKDAKRAGIDYDAKNGKEKIQRKIQKTMLQNRTLWMATAGFATPLATALFGNFVQPHIKDLVVKADFNRAKKALEKNPINEQIKNCKPIVRNEKEIEKLIKNSNGVLDDDFFKQLAQLLNPTDVIANSENRVTLEKYNSQNLINTLKEIQQRKVKIDTDSLKELLKDAKITSGLMGEEISTLSQDDINIIISTFKTDSSERNLIKLLQQNDLGDDEIKRILNGVKKDNGEFFETIKEFNKNIISDLRGKIKKYIDLADTVFASKAESMYTNEYEKSMKSLFDFLGFKRKLSKEPTLQELLEDKTMQASLYGIMNNDERYAQAAFRNAIEAKLGDAKYGSEKYNSIIKKLLEFKGQNKKELDKFFEIFSDLENISLIKPQEGEQNIEIKKLINAIMGSKSANSSLNATSSCSNISNVIKSFIDSKKIDLESGKIKAALVTNFETRLKDGSLSNLSPEQINFARKILYSTTISDALTYTNASHKQNYWDVMDCILKDENNFRAEKEIMPEFSEITKKLHVASEHLDNPKEEYLRCSSFSASLKKYATTLFNSKTWLRKFGIMAIILVAVTLLIQPLFGNIKKEFSNESKGGNK